jgi:hypothetical protein
VVTVQFDKGKITSPELPRMSVLIAEIDIGEPVLASVELISMLRPVA